jgi:hypothetical protein
MSRFYPLTARCVKVLFTPATTLGSRSTNPIVRLVNQLLTLNKLTAVNFFPGSAT